MAVDKRHEVKVNVRVLELSKAGSGIELEIFAKGKEVGLNYDSPVSLVLNEVDLQRPNKPHMEGPKTAHEEAAMMRKLYQEMVLKKKLGADVEKNTPVQIKGLSRGKKEETANV